MTMLDRFIRCYEQGGRFVVFDVETVGNLSGPTIVEIGAVEAGRNYLHQFQTFQKVLQFRPPSWEPYRFELGIHHIPPIEIENGEDRQQVFRDFLQFIAGATIISHTKFDIRALQHNIAPYQGLPDLLSQPIREIFVDSLVLAKKICPELPSCSLANLALHFEIKNNQPHRALADALTTKRVVGKLLGRYYEHVSRNRELSQ